MTPSSIAPRSLLSSRWLSANRSRLLRRGTASEEQRYRAMVRRRVLRQGRVAFLLVPLVAAFNISVHLLLGTPDLGVMVAINVSLMVMAVGARHLLGSRLARRYPEVILAAVPLAATASMVMLALLEPRMAVMASAILLLLPVTLALFIWWQPLVHAAWSACYLVLALPAMQHMQVTGTWDLGLALSAVVAVALGVIGNVLVNRADRRLFATHRRLAISRAELVRVNHSLQQSVRRDQLTGARNRLSLIEDLAVARAQIARTGTPWGLLTFDLDRFKAINDLYGHAAGDAVLRSVVEAAESVLRPADGVYRVGGEEFVVLLPEMAQADILELADRLREAVAARAIPNPGNPPHEVVTISLGATVLEAEDLELSNDDWLLRVDNALYAAKDGGRNCVKLAGRQLPRQLSPLMYDDTKQRALEATKESDTVSRTR